MYFSIGQGEVMDGEELVGIFDLDVTSQSHITREFLTRSEKSGQVVNVSEDIPKSFLVTSAEGEDRVLLSQPAPVTLVRRAAAGLSGTKNTTDSTTK